jgi:prevent-host-death family protein
MEILAAASVLPLPALPGTCEHGYNSHIDREGDDRMRTVNVATLKNQLSKYLTFAKAGEEIIIRERNLPVAKLVPFSAEDVDEQELRLVAEGKMRLPSARLDIDALLRIPTAKVPGNKAVEALLANREDE